MEIDNTKKNLEKLFLAEYCNCKRVSIFIYLKLDYLNPYYLLPFFSLTFFIPLRKELFLECAQNREK